MSSIGDAVPDFLPLPAADDEWRAGHLALAMPVFPVSMNCAEAYERFRLSTDLAAVAVVDEARHVVGLVNRLKFLAHYAQRYVPELYGRRSILQLSNQAPFLVDEDTPITELATMITFDHPEALRECFVVTRGGCYLGIGTSEALVRAKVSLLTVREKQLHKALAAAQEAYRSKSAFLALMSHELRTPLNAIIGFSEVLSSELFGPLGSERYTGYANDIHSAGKHLLNLINDILDLSKVEAGRLELSCEMFSLPDFLDDCLRFVSGRAQANSLSVSCSVPADFPLIEADRLRLKQVLLNLLSNAVKFTLPGGSIRVEAHLATDGGIIITVADTGIGMAPEAIPLALEPFRQIASPLSRKVEGTGLGLSLVKTLTELHGGRLAIQSEPDVGTTVELHFPPSRTVAKNVRRLSIG